MSENNSHDEKSESDKLKDDLEKAEKKIDTIEKKLDEQEKNTKSIRNYKSEGVTLVLSILAGLLGFMGIGHIYVGKVKRGVGILFGGFFIWFIVLILPSVAAGLKGDTTFSDVNSLVPVAVASMIIGIAGGIALFIWQILNSRKLCRQYNEHYEQHGIAPW